MGRSVVARKAKARGGKNNAPSKRIAWKRQGADHDATEKLGQRIRKHRESIGVSLSTAAGLTGIPSATLSRIETNKMSPTFPVLLKVMAGLRLHWADLMRSDNAVKGDGDISIAQPNNNAPTMVPGYAYVAPHHESPLNNRIQPVLFEVIARDLETAGGLRGHKGYEFCYILSGTIRFFIEGREPTEMPAGASILFNCEIPHAYVAVGRARARVLNVTVRDHDTLGDPRPFSARYPQLRDKHLA